MDVEQQAIDARGFQPTPQAEMRRGSAVMVLICAVAAAIGRLFFWRGSATSGTAALILFFLSIYTIFGFVQLLFGASFNEYTKNFMVASGRQKMQCVGMLVLTLGLLFPFLALLFPGIMDKF